jgi:hypothetical protein
MKKPLLARLAPASARGEVRGPCCFRPDETSGDAGMVTVAAETEESAFPDFFHRLPFFLLSPPVGGRVTIPGEGRVWLSALETTSCESP